MRSRVLPVVMAALILVLAAGYLSAKTPEAPANQPPPAMQTTLFSIIARAEINAPAKVVFAYIEDPTKVPIWFPELKTVTDVKGKGLGMTYNWTWEEGDLKGSGTNIVTEYIPNQKAAVVTSNGQVWTFILVSKGAKTELLLSWQAWKPIPNDPVALQKTLDETQAYFQGLVDNIKAQIEKK